MAGNRESNETFLCENVDLIRPSELLPRSIFFGLSALREGQWRPELIAAAGNQF
jgi:hypothetical protein